MGQGQLKGSSTLNSQLIDKLDYVLSDQSKNFPEINVYRLNEKPYDYYMRFREIIIDTQHSRKSIEFKRQIYKCFESIRCLVRVEASEVKSVVDLCSNTLEFDSYARYHNYTLEDAIDSKLTRQKKFKEGDLLYIMGSLLQVGDKINGHIGKAYRGIFKAYKVYLSTQGYIKLYPFQLTGITASSFARLQQDTATNDSLQMQQVVVNVTPKKSGEEDCTKSYKDDLKDLAILIIQLILLNKSDDFGSPNKQQLQFCLDRQVSKSLKSLLLGLLANKNEYTYESVIYEMQVVKSRQKIRPSYCIRLEEDISMRQSEIMKRQQEQIHLQKQNRLKKLSSSFHHNLVPTKIELLYNKRTSNGA